MSISDINGALLFVAHSILTVLGLFILKSSVSELEKFSIESSTVIFTLKFFLGLFVYVAAFLLSLVILRKFPLGMSVSIMMPLSLVTATVAGYFFLNEEVATQTIVGVMLILLGIFLVYANKLTF